MNRLSKAMVAAAGGAALVGCGLVADLGQFDRATNQAIDSGATIPASDAATEVDAGPDDTSSDAQASDTSAADAISVVSQGVDAAPADAGWCANMATLVTAFCDDFDESDASPGGAFTGTNFDYPGDAGFLPDSSPIPVLVTSDYVSPPNAILLTTPELVGAPGTTQGYEELNESILYRNVIHLQFAIKVPDFDMTATDLSLVRIAYAGNQWGVSLDYSNVSGFFNEVVAAPDGGQPASQYSVDEPDFTTWTVVDWVVDLKNETMTLAYNGTPVPESPIPIHAPQEQNASLLVTAGVNYLGSPALPMHVYYDDILIETPQ